MGNLSPPVTLRWARLNVVIEWTSTWIPVFLHLLNATVTIVRSPGIPVLKVDSRIHDFETLHTEAFAQYIPPLHRMVVAVSTLNPQGFVLICSKHIFTDSSSLISKQSRFVSRRAGLLGDIVGEDIKVFECMMPRDFA